MERRRFFKLIVGACVASVINIRLKEPLEIDQFNNFGLRTLTYSNYEFTNRRRIFYQYPNGALPLMGLLSMIPNNDRDTFDWFESR